MCKKQNIFGKAVLMSCLLLFVLGLPLVMSLSWLVRSDQVSNELVIGDGTIDIEETFIDFAKRNVSIYNKGNMPVYLRAEFLIYWEDAQGNVMAAEIPSGTGEKKDYQLVLGSSGDWVKGTDGFYYYNKALNAESSTTVLIDECVQVKTDYEDGRKLVVDIVAQSIQADTARAVEEAWNVSVDSGTGNLIPVSVSPGE